MPTRTDALTALLAAQSKPCVKIESQKGTDRPSSEGMVCQAGGVLRVRDRMTVA